MAGKGTEASGGILPGAVGEPTSPGSVGATRPTESNDRGADAGDRTRSGEVSCGAATDDPSRSGCADGPGFCADHRRGGTVSVWQADRGLSGSGSRGRLQWGKPTAGTYQQTGEWVNAFLPGGSGTGHGTERSRVAEQVFPSRHATRTEDRQGRHGTQTVGSSLLDVA